MSDMMIRPEASERFLPALSIEHAVRRRNMLVEFTKQLMVPSVDYGTIPGTGKPSLLKPGAEKLCTVWGLQPVFSLVRCVEDWSGTDHGGEPFFYYVYRCDLFRDGVLMAATEASCNSWEPKYRYRKCGRLCPECGAGAIMKSKNQSGGWYCFDKKGGCGANFPGNSAKSKEIESQTTGRVVNSDVAELVNTLQKMSQKRAFIGTTLVAVNASEFYTQDIEDLTIIEGHFVPDPIDESMPEPPYEAPAPAVRVATADEMKAALKAYAATEYEFAGNLGKLAVALLGYTPGKWTAEVYTDCINAHVSAWYTAFEALKPAADPVLDPAPVSFSAVVNAANVFVSAAEEDDADGPPVPLTIWKEPRPLIYAGPAEPVEANAATIAAMSR